MLPFKPKRFIVSTASAAVLALALPVASFSTAIQASGNGGSATVCVIGTCPDPEVISTSVGISPAPLSTSGPLNFTYSFANGDQYKVTGSYSASYASGISLNFSPIISYVGNNGNAVASVGADVLTLDFFQNFYDNGPGTWNSPPSYCETLSATVNGGISTTAAAKFDGISIGTITATSGTSSNSMCAALTFPGAQSTASFLDGDYTLTASFAAGTNVGASINTAVPEPSALGYSLLGGALSIIAYRRRRLFRGE